MTDFVNANHYQFGIKVCYNHLTEGKRDTNAWLHSQNAVRVKDFASAFPTIITPDLNMNGFILKKMGVWLLPLDKPTPITDAVICLSLDMGFYISDYLASLQPKAETKAAMALATAYSPAAAVRKEFFPSAAAKAAAKRARTRAKPALTPDVETLLKKLTPPPRRKSKSQEPEDQEQEQEQEQEKQQQQQLDPLDLEGWTTV